MATGYTFTSSGKLLDLEDILVKRDVFSQGNLWSWGNNFIGVLATDNTINYSSPVTVAGNSGTWKQVSLGAVSAAAIKSDGTLWTWGSNFEGNLGDNTFGTGNRSSPQTTTAGGNNWVKVSVGSFAGAIKSDGTLWTWGFNGYGELGANNTVNSSSPQTTVAGGSNWKFINCSYSGPAAIKEDGTLWTWGNAVVGQQGHGDTVTRSSPQTVISGGNNWQSIAGGNYHKIAIKTDGTMWTWGENGYGELGSDEVTTVKRSSPQTTAAGGNSWKAVAAKYYNSAAIKNDGTLWTWGNNEYGQIGNNTISFYSGNRISPQTTVAGGTNWRKVEIGGGMMAAIKTDGTLWTWGYNNAGSLGDGTASTQRSSPATIIAGSATNNIVWKDITVSGYSVYLSSMAQVDTI